MQIDGRWEAEPHAPSQMTASLYASLPGMSLYTSLCLYISMHRDGERMRSTVYL